MFRMVTAPPNTSSRWLFTSGRFVRCRSISSRRSEAWPSNMRVISAREDICSSPGVVMLSFPVNTHTPVKRSRDAPISRRHTHSIVRRPAATVKKASKAQSSILPIGPSNRPSSSCRHPPPPALSKDKTGGGGWLTPGTRPTHPRHSHSGVRRHSTVLELRCV